MIRRSFLKVMMASASPVLWAADGSGLNTKASPLVPGRDYFPLNLPTSTKQSARTVVEVFSYGCPHCAALESKLASFRAQLPNDVKFGLLPVIFAPEWESYARSFYAAQSLGLLSQTHAALFQAVAKKGRASWTLEQLADEFYSRYGVDHRSFVEEALSAKVTKNVAQSAALARAYGVDQTPTFIVNSQFRVEIKDDSQASVDRVAFVVSKLLSTSQLR